MSGESLRHATATELRAAFQSGAATSRAVTDERDDFARDGAELFLDRENVRQHLAGMFFVRERIDDGNAREFGEFLEQTIRLRPLLVARVGPDEQGALHHLWLFLNLKHPKEWDIASVAAPPQGG